MKIRFYFLGFLVLSSLCLKANNSGIENLPCDSLNTIIKDIFANDQHEEQVIREQAPDFYRIMQEKGCSGLADAMNLLGIIHFNKGELLEAKNILLRADSLLNALEEESPSYVRNQLWLGLTNVQERRYESAKLHFDKSIRLSERINFKKGLLQAYLNFGTAYLAQDDHEAAETNLLKALEINEEIQNQLWGGYVYFNLSRIYLAKGDQEQALEFNRQVGAIWEGLQYYKGLYYNHLHYYAIYKDDNNVELGVSHLKKALSYAEKDQTILPHNTYVILGYHYYYGEAKDLDQAKFYFEKALQNSQTIDEQQLTDLVALLLNIYAEEQDVESIKRINTYLLEVYRSKAESGQVEARKWQNKELTLEDKISENRSLMETQLKNELVLQRRNLLLLFLLVLVIVVIVVSYNQYRAAKQRKTLLRKIRSQHQEVTQANKELLTQKAKIEEQNRTILKAQDQLIVQEKLASLGQLTAGIAHEIKNPLNFVNNFAEGSRELLDELAEELKRQQPNIPPKQFSALQAIIKDLHLNATDIYNNGSRADRIVSSMMEHTRDSRGERDRQLVNLNDLLDENANLAYHAYRAIKPSFQVNIEKAYDPNLPLAKVIPGNLGRVLLNILNNACYAVYRKQQSAEPSYTPTITLRTKSGANEVFIYIRDNGLGIPAKIRKEIFTPFFTTKSTGEGNTGLGLSISYNIIVKEHHGKLEVDSEPGKFTEFRIALPVDEKKQEI